MYSGFFGVRSFSGSDRCPVIPGFLGDRAENLENDGNEASEFAPENKPFDAPKGNVLVFQPSIFRGYVSFRECTCLKPG